MDLKKSIRIVEDFPKEGISFKDITTLIADGEAFKYSIDSIAEHLKDKKVDVILGPEARGFIFGMPLAYILGKSFVLIRKKGKLPCETISESYDLEYGKAEIEIHTDSIKPGQKVVLVDDLIATGGTIEAAIKLIERLGGEVVDNLFLVELAGLKGRERLSDYRVDAVVTYEGK